MLPFKLIYHQDYDLHLCSHVFPSQKYRLVHDAALAEGIAAPEDFLKPNLADDVDVLRVHTSEYVHKLKTGRSGSIAWISCRKAAPRLPGGTLVRATMAMSCAGFCR